MQKRGLNRKIAQCFLTCVSMLQFGTISSTQVSKDSLPHK